MPVFQIFPLLFLLLAAPILIARSKSGISTWFPAQILAFFGLVAGIVVRESGALPFLDHPPLLAPILGVLAAQLIAIALLR